MNNIRQLYRQKLPTKRVNYSTSLFHGTLMVYHGARPVYYKRCTACRRATRVRREHFETFHFPGKLKYAGIRAFKCNWDKRENRDVRLEKDPWLNHFSLYIYILEIFVYKFCPESSDSSYFPKELLIIRRLSRLIKPWFILIIVIESYVEYFKMKFIQFHFGGCSKYLLK